MRTEGFKRGVASILLVFALMFSMILVTPLASPGDLIYNPGGTTIEIVQGENFVIRHVLEWDDAQDGAYTVTIAWTNYDNDPSENLTFLSAEAYFTTGPNAGESTQADVMLASALSGSDTNWALSVSRPADNKDPRNGEFNVDIWMGAFGVGGVPHIPTDNHPILEQFAGVIVIESGLVFGNRAPITIKVSGRGVSVSISPSENSGLPEETLSYTVTVTNTGNVDDNYDLTVSDNADWSPTPIVSENSLEVPAGETRTATLTVTIPDVGDVSPGEEDEITVTATSTENAEISDNATCIARAVIERDVEVSISPPENSGIPGENITFTVTVINKGDVADSYYLEASDNADWDPAVSPFLLGIGGGSSSTATLSVVIHEGTSAGVEDEITVKATSNTDNTVSDSATCIARVVVGGDLIYNPGGTTIEVVQGDNFLIRHTLEWNEPEDGAYAITLYWVNYDNDPSENFTFVETSAYFTTGPNAGESILAVVKLGSAPAGTNTKHVLSVKCPPDQKDSRNGQFNVDITLSASGVGGIPHIPGDHVIPWQFGGIIIFENDMKYWNRDPITIRVLATCILPHDPIYIEGNAGFTPENGVNGGGSGTENDPYIIENWDISAENANGIEIRNTTAHFVIRNCYVHDGKPYYRGIYFQSVVNGKIDNNIVENNEDGMVLLGSKNNIFNNLVANNRDYGIFLYYSYNTLVKANRVENNDNGISLDYSNSNTIQNNTCLNNENGIKLYHSDNNLISNNIVRNNGTSGIWLDLYSANNTLLNNIVENNEDGILLWGSKNNIISNNIVEYNNFDGIYLRDSDNNLIMNNVMENNFFGIDSLYSNNNVMTNNIVEKSYTGIRLVQSHNNLISNNIVKDNPYRGIYLAGSDNNLVTNSLLENNGYGIRLSANNNHIYHNNFMNNATQAYVDDGYNYWDNGYPSGGNYWSDYTGVDADGDGIGDTPYNILGGADQDRYPLMNLWSTPDYVYLTWVSPDTAHTINVSWRTDEDYVGEVRYDTEARGGAPDAYISTTGGTGGVTTSKFEGYIHHVELTELEPDTIYYFICGNPDYGWSEELSFRTAPVEGKDIRFAVGGDSRSQDGGGADWPDARDGVSQLMASYDPDFVIFSGDFLWSGEEQVGPDTWDNWLGAMYKYWRTDGNRLIPIIPAIGNHELVYPQPSDYDPETHASNYYMLFNLPRNERWYSLNWGPDLHIVVLDSEIRLTGGESWTDQLEWLGQDLLEHWDDRWKIATAHRPAFSSGHYSGDTNIQRDWIPEFDLYHVDLYFSGHDHNYQRTHPINFSISTENYQPSPENGTIYMVSAGWGAPLYGGSPRWWTAYGPDGRYHFTLVDAFENGTLHFQAINLDGTVFDEFSIYRDLDVSILPGEVIVGGKDTAYNTDLYGPSPLKSYASSPPLMVAAKVGSGAVVATGSVSTTRDTRWNGEGNPAPNFDVLLDKAFQWMVPGATKVLWFEGYGVYNTIDTPEVQCQQLEDALEAKGYTLTGDTTTPITSGLLSGYDILVIPQMQLGETSTGGNPALLPDADVQTIKTWVEGGGGLLIMESSDYFGLNYSEVHNKILTALGAGFYFQDDQVQDDTNQWGQAAYQPIAVVDTTTEIGSAYQSETGTDEIGLYSICSLRIEVDYEVSVTVSPTIKVGAAGEILIYEGTITNTGTKSDTYTLTAEDELGWSTSLSKNAVSLEPGESEVVEASVTVPTNLTEKVVNWVTITASGVSEDDARCRAINVFAQDDPPYPIASPNVTRFLGPGLPTLLVDSPAVPVITAIETGFSMDLTPREPEPILYGKGEFAPVVAVELIGNGRVIAIPNSILRDAYYDRPELANDEVTSMIVRWMLDWADPRGHSLLYWVTEGSYHLPPGTSAPVVAKYINMLAEDYGLTVGTQVGGEITSGLIGEYDIIHLNETLRPLSSQEIQAVVDYVNGGGGLIIGSPADYGGFGSPTFPNEVLEALGSGIRFQDDELYDEDKWVVDGPWFPQVYFLDPREANPEFDVWFPEHDFTIYMPKASMTLESAPALFPLMITNTGTKGSTYRIEVEEITQLGWDVEVNPAIIDVGSGESAEIFITVTVPDIAVGRERINLLATVTDDAQAFLTKSKLFAVLGEDGRMPPEEAKFEVGQSVSHDDWGDVTIEAFGWDGSAWAYIVETADGELKLAAEAELVEIPLGIEWDASITATFSGGSDGALFGVRSDATDNFDSVYDIPEPPAPPEPPHVRAYFYYPGQTLDELHCSYLAPENLMEWPLRIEYAEGLEDITLTWNVEDVPADYSIFLYRGGDLVADMRAEDNYTFEVSTGSYDFRIVVGRIVPFTLELAQGWNMISFPVLPENPSPDSIFGSYYVLYRWDAVNKRYVLHADSGSFVEPDPIVEVGVGYWAYVLENENVALLGVPATQLTLNLRQGWSLIGPPYGGSGIADPADDPDISVLPYAFTWNAREKSYSMTQLLEAGKGYWAYTLRDCTLELPDSLLHPPQPGYPAIAATSAKSGDNEIRINVVAGSIPTGEWAYSVSMTEGSYSWTTGTEELDSPYVSLGTYAAGTYYVSLRHIYSGHFYFWDQTITIS